MRIAIDLICLFGGLCYLGLLILRARQNNHVS